VQALLVALFERDATGAGLFIDVSMHAAANVTTEVASYGYLAEGKEVGRQTGRHAWWEKSSPTQIQCADGRYMNTGTLPRTPREFAAILTWLDELGLRDEFPLSAILEMGANLETIDLSHIDRDPLLPEILGAAREVGVFLAERLGAYEEFVGWQKQGMAAGVVYSPDEALADPHVVARGFPTEVEHPEHDRVVTYPGPLFRLSATPATIRHRAPLLGEHQGRVGAPGAGD
jgi:crotonobetainyl-CoA:carnitine CoA-transferase CaiB-like acyl-CoA transferase